MEYSMRSACSWAGALLGLLLLGLNGCGGGGGGSDSALGAFNPDVSSSGVATLTWTPPTTRLDGNALNDLAGYKIYYGTEKDQYTEVVDVPNAGISEYMVEGLGSGTYYFVVTAYDTAGNESPPSNEASKAI